MYTVGEFSKICQVSVKTLHYYDRIGLLPPLTVDAETGYRYYGIEQVNQMLLISRLKRYGLSLEDIRTFLSPESDYAQLSLLKKHHQQLKTQQYVLTQIISELEGHLHSFERTGNLMDYQNRYTITLTTAPCHPVLTSRKAMAINDFGSHYSALSMNAWQKNALHRTACAAPSITMIPSMNQAQTLNSLLVFKKPTKLMTLLVACNAR